MEQRAPTVLSAEKVTKTVTMANQTLTILHQIDIEVLQGQSIAIVGESGSGKSTLLGLLAGLDVPSSGQITLAGQNLHALSEDDRASVRARQVGFVFQAFQLMPNLTAMENVMLPLEISNQTSVPEKAKAILSQVGLEHRLSHYPNQLSGGEQQRVALARAFVSQPEILFADEPTGNLDTRTGNDIADQLFEMNQSRNTTLILVTHDLALADRCDRVLVMSAGQLQERTQ